MKLKKKTTQDKNDNKPVTLDDLMEFFQGVIVPYMAGEFDKVNGRLDSVEERLGKVEERLGRVEERLGRVENDLMYVKNDVRDLKTDMPTKEEFEVVRKLEKLHQHEMSAFI